MANKIYAWEANFIPHYIKCGEVTNNCECEDGCPSSQTMDEIIITNIGLQDEIDQYQVLRSVEASSEEEAEAIIMAYSFC